MTRRAPLPLPRLVFSSLWVVLAATFVRASMPLAWELELLCIWLLSWSTCVLRSLSLLAMLPVTTRSLVLCPVTSPLLSRMMKSSTSSLVVSPLLLVVFFPTFMLSFFPRRAPSKEIQKKQIQPGTTVPIHFKQRKELNLDPSLCHRTIRSRCSTDHRRRRSTDFDRIFRYRSQTSSLSLLMLDQRHNKKDEANRHDVVSRLKRR